MHKRAGTLLQTWRDLVDSSESITMITTTVGSKRKMEIGVDEIEIRSMYEDGKLSKVGTHQFSVTISSKPRLYSSLLNNSRHS